MPANSPPPIWRELRALLIAVGLGFYAVVLASYSHTDSAWSMHSSTSTETIENWGGVLGAWFSDISYYLLGYSVWWLFLGALVWGLLLWREREALRWERPPPESRRNWRLLGFAMLLIASTSTEFLGRASEGQLPLAPGGLVGSLIGNLLEPLIGFYAALILALLGVAMGFSLLIQVSWLRIAEGIGGLLEGATLTLWDLWQRHRDKQVGERAAAERQALIEKAKEQRAEKEMAITTPVPSPPPPPAPPAPAKKVAAAKAVSAQQPLFSTPSDLPTLSLLNPIKPSSDAISKEHIELISRLIERKLAEFRVGVAVVAAQPGPVITRYEVEPAEGVKGSQVVGLATDLARGLSLPSIRVVETIPGKKYMGLELPNPRRQMVQLAEIMSAPVYQNASSLLTLVLGKDIAGNPVVADLAKMPHLLVAGTTGSGKSVGVNAMILSLLYRANPDEVRLIMIDPKMLEMSIYEDIPHLIAPVVTDMRQAANALNWCVGEMERRYRLMSKLGVRNLAGYNQKVAGSNIPNPFSLTPDNPELLTRLPNLVIFIDELADLMMVVGKKVEELIARIAQKARAAGIHLVLATQRPSVDVITGLIKANIPTRISFQVSSKIDSRTILDQMGAEALLGMGDMLYLPAGSGYPVRVHGAFVADEEVHRVVEFLKEKGPPNYIEGVLEGGTEGGEGTTEGGSDASDGERDPLYDEAVAIVLQSKRASISFVQQKLRIGYNRSARLLEQMEMSGVVSAMQSNGQRQVLVPNSGGD